MYVVATDTLIADIATEFDMTPTEASLICRDVLLDNDDDSEGFDFDS